MTRFGQPHRHYGRCTSTNDVARDWALDPDDPAPSGALVSAAHQTRGRGRQGRSWKAAFGQNALLSYVCTPVAVAERGQIALVTGLAVVKALASLGLQPRLKWPNDVLLEGRKAGGVLVEVRGETAILGIGINVNQTRFLSMTSFAFPPTSLRLVSGRGWNLREVDVAVSGSLTVWEGRWRRLGFAAILEDCRAHLATGATVRRGEQGAELVGLGEDGGAEVRLPDGTFDHWTTVD